MCVCVCVCVHSFLLFLFILSLTYRSPTLLSSHAHTLAITDSLCVCVCVFRLLAIFVVLSFVHPHFLLSLALLSFPLPPKLTTQIFFSCKHFFFCFFFPAGSECGRTLQLMQDFCQPGGVICLICIDDVDRKQAVSVGLRFYRACQTQKSCFLFFFLWRTEFFNLWNRHQGKVEKSGVPRSIKKHRDTHSQRSEKSQSQT